MTELNIYYNNILLIPTAAFAISVFIKWSYSIIKTWKVNLRTAFWSWWMPSAHTAVTVWLTTAIGLKYWVTSDFFALALSFTVIIIYDAINVRYESGLHAWALNRHIWERKFRESLGHLPSEAFAWSFVWIFTAIFIFYL